MANILINLLPAELKQIEKEKTRRSKVVKSVVVFMIIVVTATAGVFVQSITKKNEQQQASQEIITAEQKVSSLNEQEGVLTVLKKRLEAIKTLTTADTALINTYKLMFTLTPSNVSMKSLKVDSPTQVNITGDSSNAQAFENFLDNLTNSEKHNNKIAKVIIDNLTRSPQGAYTFDLTLNLNAQ